MVLGVNDISQIASPALFESYDDIYINEVIKQKTNEANGWNTDNCHQLVSTPIHHLTLYEEKNRVVQVLCTPGLVRGALPFFFGFTHSLTQ